MKAIDMLLKGYLLDIAEKKNISVIYFNLPKDVKSLYIKTEEGYLIISLNERFKGSFEEIEGLAEGLAYNQVTEEYKININTFKDDKNLVKCVDEKMIEYKDRLLCWR